MNKMAGMVRHKFAPGEGPTVYTARHMETA
jgi:hypothetical protein